MACSRPGLPDSPPQTGGTLSGLNRPRTGQGRLGLAGENLSRSFGVLETALPQLSEIGWEGWR
jgi:hypothetical protein